jgi:hypothetical protein
MPKYKLEDMKKLTSHKAATVRAVPPLEAATEAPKTTERAPEQNTVQNDPPKRPHPKTKTTSPVPRQKASSKPRTVFFGLLIFAVISVLGYSASSYFTHVKVALQNKTESFTLDHKQFTASKNDTATVPFEIMIVSDTQTKEMTLTESTNVSAKAKGKLMLYNEYSTTAQKISVASYVSDTTGKTYKTDTVVTIPGYTTSGGKIIPGKVPVSVTAFLPGSSYNTNSTDFTINAFKGTTKFKKIYAKAITPITGGSVGLVYVLSASEKGTLAAFADTTFKNSLYKKAYAQVPPGYILYPDALQFSSDVDTNTSYETANAKIPITGTAVAFLVKEKDMTTAVIKAVLPNTPESELKEIEIPEISKLSFSFVNTNQPITKDLQATSFTLTGPLTAVWHPDIEALKASLVGVPKLAVSEIFKKDPGIKNARVTMFPPWQRSLPQDVSKINILLE